MNKKLLLVLSSVGISVISEGVHFSDLKENGEESDMLYRPVQIETLHIERHNAVCTGSCQR